LKLGLREVNMELKDYNTEEENAWCPGCGNFGVLNALKKALVELNIEPKNLVISSGIGQAAKTPHYVKCNFFNGLHGRALPPATAIKAVNPALTVIAESGDGCSYGEGGNHFIHTVRRNPDITHIVHNNMVYGLTKGQFSATADLGSTKKGGAANDLPPFDCCALALQWGATFVARSFSGDKEQLVPLIQAGCIDWMVSTGANLYHDTHFALDLALHRGSPFHSDKDLRDEGVIRIYDILFDYTVLLDTDAFYRELSRPRPSSGP